jgi:hypothetical protein
MTVNPLVSKMVSKAPTELDLLDGFVDGKIWSKFSHEFLRPAKQTHKTDS